MKTCAAAAPTKVNFNMKIHMTAGKALKAEIAAKKATKAIAKAAATTPKIKFNMKIHMPAAAGKALKDRLAAMKATKAIAKDVKKAAAKDIKKAFAKETKKDNANDSKEGHNDAQGVLDLFIEELDLHNRGLESVEMDPSNTNTGVSSKAIEDLIEKTLSNLSIDQV